jgi:hypothetical protein
MISVDVDKYSVFALMLPERRKLIKVVVANNSRIDRKLKNI